MYVVDASVILKWFVEEDDTKKAIAIKETHITRGFTLVIPDIAIYEVANALRYNPKFSFEEVNRCCNDLYDLDIDIVAPVPETINSASEIAYQKDITFYDAFYIALAKELNFQFLTADEKLYNKVKGLSFVQLLNQLSPP